MEIRKIDASKPRVALLVDNWLPLHGGEHTPIARLIHGLLEEGYLVDLFTPGGRSLLPRGSSLTKEAGLKVIHLPTLGAGLVAFLKLLWRGKSYYTYHAHSASMAAAMKAASWFTSVPTLLTVHNHHTAQKVWSLRKILDRVLFLETRYSQVISVSESFLKAKNVNEKIMVIPHGIDVSDFDAVKVKKNREQFLALFVGPLSQRKGVDLLLQACQRFVESNDFVKSRRDFMLHLVSGGKDHEPYKKQVQEMGLEKYVRFHGNMRRDRLIELYKSVDLFVLPSRSDALPLALLEACAAKLPILASNVGDHRKLVLENTNGHLVPPGDVDELVYYLEHFALNPHLEQMGQASYDLLEQEYKWETFVSKTLRAYEHVDHQDASKDRVLWPWSWPTFLMQRRKMNQTYKGRAPLRFCLTVSLEGYHHNDLPDEVDHVLPFLERFAEFCATLDIPSTLFVQSDLYEPLDQELHTMQEGGHELALLASKKDWQSRPKQGQVLRELRKQLKDQQWENISFFRAHKEIHERELSLLHENDFEYLPVTEDPLPHLKWYKLLPHKHRFEMNLENFLALSEEELIEMVNRIRAYQRQNKVDPFIIFECKSWEFQSHEGSAHASGENFTALSKRLNALSRAMPLEFLSLSSFCKSCKVGS